MFDPVLYLIFFFLPGFFILKLVGLSPSKKSMAEFIIVSLLMAVFVQIVIAFWQLAFFGTEKMNLVASLFLTNSIVFLVTSVSLILKTRKNVKSNLHS